MAQHRGSKGRFAVGGIVVGSPLVQGAVAQDAESATFDGSPLNGVVQPGDTFTVAGDAQEYTVVTGGAVAGDEVAVTFTPGVVEAAGWADNAAVTFASNSMGQVRNWEARLQRPFIEGTVLESEAEVGSLDTPACSGRARVILDYDDPKQKSVVDQVVSNADPTALSFALQVASGKFIYVDALVPDVRIQAERGAFVEADVDWRGQGNAAVSWT